METNPHKTLIVLLHGYAMGLTKYHSLKEKILSVFPNSIMVVPKMPLSVFSCANPNTIVNSIITEIDTEWGKLEASDKKSLQIIIIGHSTGALLARKLYIVACGENKDALFEKEFTDKATKEWAKNVERLILFAGINKGWELNPHLPLGQNILMRCLTTIGNLMVLTGLKPVAFKTKKGNPFVTMVRIQALSMLNHSKAKGAGNALTIQLLGTQDTIVSPEDNIDLLTGHHFVYLEIERSDHLNVIEMKGTNGPVRAEVVEKALTQDRETLRLSEVIPSDEYRIAPDLDVTDVVFVIHGIRDTGYWTQKIAMRVKSKGDKLPGKKFATETSTYGYFPILSFLLYPVRQEKVKWFMEQYIENLALYPNASFSFIGHSNGTYLLAKALKDYQSVKFKNVVLAGSVVAKNYGWTDLIGEKRIECIYNVVANNDWVVGIFPRTFQRLRIQDLGSGGYDGFKTLSNNEQFKYISGGHGAGVEESTWNELAHIITHSKPSRTMPFTKIDRSLQMRTIAFLGPILFFGALILLGYIGFLIFGWSDAEPWRFIRIVLYLALVWRVLTRF